MLGEGRTITLSGNARYIEYVENYYDHGDDDRKNAAEYAVYMAEELKGEEGQSILKNLQEHGVLDENFYPLELSHSESAVLAYQISIVLNIKEVWKVFSSLWRTSPNGLRAAYNKGMEQKKTMKFLEKITPLLKV